MTQEHISTQFDAELEEIRNRMLRMGGLVEEQLGTAMKIYESGDRALLDTVNTNEHSVNALEIELDDRCTHIIARRQPTASDLRLVIAVIKTITDLERIGDEAAKIARISDQLHGRAAERPGTPSIPTGFSGLRVAMNLAVAQLRKALDTFARLDASTARQIVLHDKMVDDEFRRLLRELLTFMFEDPRTISASVDIIWMAKALERIGDHAKNIAEYVIFIAEGTDVRHRRLDPT
jgi:phosphate transport system protein